MLTNTLGFGFPTNKYATVAIAALGISLLSNSLTSKLQIILYLVGLISSAFLGVLLYIFLRLHFSPKYDYSTALPISILRTRALICEQFLNNEDKTAASGISPPKISRNIDQVLNELIELITR